MNLIDLSKSFKPLKIRFETSTMALTKKLLYCRLNFDRLRSHFKGGNYLNTRCLFGRLQPWLITPPFYPRPRVLISVGLFSKTEASANCCRAHKEGQSWIFFFKWRCFYGTFSWRIHGAIPALTKYGNSPNQVRLRLRAPHIFILNLAQFCLMLAFLICVSVLFFCSNWVKNPHSFFLGFWGHWPHSEAISLGSPWAHLLSFQREAPCA
jgi:hypothetical protein